MSIFQSMKSDSKTKTDKIETIIGPSVNVEGDFKGESDVLVAGSVHGTLTTSENLTIAESADIHADIGGQNIKISGQVHGNIVAKDRLEIMQSATIVGDMEASVVSIEAGAKIEGRCATTQAKEKNEVSVLNQSSFKKEKNPKAANVPS